MERQGMISFLPYPFPHSVALYSLTHPHKKTTFINVNSPLSHQIKHARIPTPSSPSGKPTANPIAKLTPCKVLLLLKFVDWLGDNTVVVPVCCEMLADVETVVPGTETA